MNTPIEVAMYDISQLFLYPCSSPSPRCSRTPSMRWAPSPGRPWRACAGRRRASSCRPCARRDLGTTVVELETLAIKRLGLARIATRVAPMLGLVATMIPMGPALKALADERSPTCRAA